MSKVPKDTRSSVDRLREIQSVVEWTLQEMAKDGMQVSRQGRSDAHFLSTNAEWIGKTVGKYVAKNVT